MADTEISDDKSTITPEMITIAETFVGLSFTEKERSQMCGALNARIGYYEAVKYPVYEDRCLRQLEQQKQREAS
jgi:hypothetical protein